MAQRDPIAVRPVRPAATTAAGTPTRGPHALADRGLARAIVEAVAYADLFDSPLREDELLRYLPGVAASPAAVRAALPAARVARRDGMITLAGREGLLQVRRRRERIADAMWREARRNGRRLSALPFVRMVAVTGALAMDNVEAGADIDLLVVARAGRVWTCRTFVTALARAASRRGPTLCPNYVIGEGSLVLTERSLYIARELAQMVPLHGLATYERLRADNRWVEDALPNAAGPPRPVSDVPPRSRGRAGIERALGGRLGDRVERRLQAWQERRLRRKIAGGALGSGEARFAADAFKGHFDGHGRRILDLLARRLAALEEVAP